MDMFVKCEIKSIYNSAMPLNNTTIFMFSLIYLIRNLQLKYNILKILSLDGFNENVLSSCL